MTFGDLPIRFRLAVYGTMAGIFMIGVIGSAISPLPPDPPPAPDAGFTQEERDGCARIVRKHKLEGDSYMQCLSALSYMTR